MSERIDLSKPRYDQSTYIGRAKYFFITTNPLNIFSSDATLQNAKQLVEAYKIGKEPIGTTDDQVWRAKNIYDSAFHPDTKEKMFILGRMSAQVPMNMMITGCMMTFYKSTPSVIFWQWFNQSFNAVVNYTNRSGDSPISVKTLGLSYLAATGGALSSALFFNKIVKTMPPLVGRFVPFVAVAFANCINIPCMRSRELMYGIPIFTEKGERVGESSIAASTAIFQVVLSRIFMASPGMLFPPLIMSKLEKGQFLKKFPIMIAPVQVGIVGLFLVFATPMCCALFPQMSSIKTTSLEADLQAKLSKQGIEKVYYNKGL